ncbi:MAG: alpha/beta hydrolase [Proteobacteria bacterium]|nr:alpha/beta hydrolase [Pseudomonadota bacterium]
MHASHFGAVGNLQMAHHRSHDPADKRGGKKPALILLHGFTGSKLDFHDQLEWFDDLRQTFAYDQRGHGETTNALPYNLNQLVTDLIGWMNRQDLDQVDLLGHSMGGMVALRAVLAHPERFRSLILMDTAPSGIDLMAPAIRDRLNSLVMADGCQALVKMMRSQPASRPAQRGIDFLGEDEHWRRIQVKLTQMDPQAFVDLGRQLAEQVSVADRLSAINCPTTILVGEHDAPFVGPSREMAGAIENANLVVIPKAGHSPQYENPEVWREALRAHLIRG